MKVFKYLVALADISVGFLGLFFVIFAVARPTVSGTTAERSRLRQTVDSLRQEIRELEKIKLGRAAGARKLAGEGSAKIIVAPGFITAEVSRRRRRFATVDEFVAAAPAIPWTPNVVLYIDHRVPFEKVIAVIDALKRTGREISVQIAALAK